MVEGTIERRRKSRPRPAVIEVGQARLLLLAIAVWVCFSDLIVKLTEPTRSGFYHKRTGAELAIILAITFTLAYVAPLIRSRMIVAGAGLMVGGGLGNGLSIVIFPQGVPNPFMISQGDWTIALNLADISVALGFALATVAVLRFAADMRGELRYPIERRATSARPPD
jgi:hypothetical protein